MALAIVGLVPVVLTGFVSYSVNRDELETTVGESQTAMAVELARSCERYVARAIESVRQSTRLLPVDQLSRDELGSVLRVPYAQLEFVRALALFDEAGRTLAEPVFGARAGESGGGDQATEPGEFLQRVPVRLAIDAGTAMSRPYRTASGKTRLAIALRLGEGKRVVGAELAIDEIESGFAVLPAGSEAVLAAPDGTVLAGAARTLSPDEAMFAAGAGAPRSTVVRRADGREWLASAARVPQMGWTVLIAQPAAQAFHPADRVRRYTAFWAGVSLVLIAFLGLLLGGSLTGPVRQLSRAVDTVGEGRYDIELPVNSRDEIGRLASAFARMTQGLKRRDEEIRRWNAELQKRVDERTAELRAAQDQILRTRRLTALGALGAGLAHELNNPLTAITGLLSIVSKELEAGSRNHAMIQTVMEQAYRVARIVEDVRRFTDNERQEGVRFPLERPVRAALEQHSEEIQRRKIRLIADLSNGEAQGDPRQIQQVVDHLVRNAIQAMPQGGDLRVTLSDVAGEALKLTVSDTGKGIPRALCERIFDPFFTTKPPGANAGLGLSISHTIVEAHHGKIEVDSAEGKGATFTVLLPAAPAAAHLA